MHQALASFIAPFACAALLCASPLALAANPTSSGNCEESSTNMSEVRACLHEQNVAMVKAAYASLSIKLKARMPQASEELEVAQRNWVQYARSACEFLAEFNSASFAKDDARTNCWSDFARARTKQLKSWEMQLDKKP